MRSESKLLILGACVALLTGCANVKRTLAGFNDIPAFTVITDRGDVVTRDNDGNTTVTLAPFYLPAPGPRPIKSYSLEK